MPGYLLETGGCCQAKRCVQIPHKESIQRSGSPRLSHESDKSSLRHHRLLGLARARIAKNYKEIRQNSLFMKIDNLVAGLIVIAFGALLLADAILTTVDPASQLFSPNDVKGMVGMVLVVLAAIYFKKTKE